jgi:hypothetical protein
MKIASTTRISAPSAAVNAVEGDGSESGPAGHHTATFPGASGLPNIPGR